MLNTNRKPGGKHAYRSFFKKWLDLEKRRGDEAGVEAVKQKAIEWTQKAVNS
jgi:rRNA biogenesis protein RRP5